MSETAKYPSLKNVCFTGHRLLDDPKADVIPFVLKKLLNNMIKAGSEDFYAGGALGFDTIAAVCVLEMKKIYPHIKLHLILPCKDQTRRWKEEDRIIYNNILRDADSVEYLHECYTPGCMHDRNRRLVDLSTTCIAYLLHNGGGTHYTVSYALNQGKDLINLADMIKSL